MHTHKKKNNRDILGKKVYWKKDIPRWYNIKYFETKFEYYEIIHFGIMAIIYFYMNLAIIILNIHGLC